MKKLRFFFAFSLVLFVSSHLQASQEVEVEIGHGSVSHDHLLLQVGDGILFTNVVDMEGGHSIAITDGEKSFVSPPMEKGEKWRYEFKRAGNYSYFIQEHQEVKGQVTVFAGDKMALAVSDLRKEMVSYSLGYDLGEQVVKRLDNLDIQLFISGLQHAYNDEDPKLEEGEMEFIIADYKREVARRGKQKFEEISKKNLNESTKFLSENKKNKGVVVSDSGLQYVILRKGNGKRPVLGDKVKVHYKGTFINGIEFDNTYSTGESEFSITSQVLPGLVEGLLLMSEGSKWQLFVPPHLAFGFKGQRDLENEQMSIEPNSTLLFEVELIDVLGDNMIQTRSQAGAQ